MLRVTIGKCSLCGGNVRRDLSPFHFDIQCDTCGAKPRGTTINLPVLPMVPPYPMEPSLPYTCPPSMPAFPWWLPDTIDPTRVAYC